MISDEEIEYATHDLKRATDDESVQIRIKMAYASGYMAGFKAGMLAEVNMPKEKQ